MAKTTIKGTGAVTSADFKNVKYVGKTKSGSAVTITLKNAINMGNLDWAFAEKDDLVASIEFQGCYDNTDEMANSTEEPWTVEIDNMPTTASGEIVLGIGKFFVGETAIALCRGGGSFNVEREFREIRADGDRGAVKDRISLEESRPKLTMNTLHILSRMADIYSAISVS